MSKNLLIKKLLVTTDSSQLHHHIVNYLVDNMLASVSFELGTIVFEQHLLDSNVCCYIVNNEVVSINVFLNTLLSTTKLITEEGF